MDLLRENSDWYIRISSQEDSGSQFEKYMKQNAISYVKSNPSLTWSHKKLQTIESSIVFYSLTRPSAAYHLETFFQTIDQVFKKNANLFQFCNYGYKYFAPLVKLCSHHISGFLMY